MRIVDFRKGDPCPSPTGNYRIQKTAFVRTAVALLFLSLFSRAALSSQDVGHIQQPLVSPNITSPGVQESYGLLSLSSTVGTCSATLLTNQWAITAAHCL